MERGTSFTAVRFGNVLGSRGSVVPTFERQIYRALAALERLQRLRSGEPVPPPLSVAVDAIPPDSAALS